MAQARGQPLDGHPRQRPGGHRLRSERRQGACWRGRTGDDTSGDGLSVQRRRHADRDAQRQPAAVPAAASHSVVGRGRHGHAQRHAGGRRHARRLRPDRAVVESGRDSPPDVADARSRVDLVSRLRSGGTWTAGVLAARWRGLAARHQRDEKAGAVSGRRLGGVADHSLELRPARRGRWRDQRRRVHAACRRAAGGTGAVCARGATGRDRSDRTPGSGMAVGGRLGGDAPAKPGHQSRERRDAAPGPLWDGAAPNNGVSRIE